MRNDHLLMAGKLRYSVISCQRHSVTDFRQDSGMLTGERIKRRRKELGMTAQDLADAAGIARTTLYDLERGDSKSTTKLHIFVRLVDGKVDAFGTRGDFDSTKNPTQDINIKKEVTVK